MDIQQQILALMGLGNTPGGVLGGTDQSNMLMGSSGMDFDKLRQLIMMQQMQQQQQQKPPLGNMGMDPAKYPALQTQQQPQQQMNPLMMLYMNSARNQLTG